jgi:ribosomal-protein-alanine N-acetyltransferase
MNADPEVMRFFPAPLSRAESDAFVGRIRQAFAQQGWGLWALEVRDSVEFGGFVGLARPSFDAHFTPCVEIGWRLARPLWGRGYAPAAAAAVLDLAFAPATSQGAVADVGLGLAEVVSMTTVHNTPSRRVMEKLGMTRDPADDFEHPRVPIDSPLRPHVLYRITASDWRRRRDIAPGVAPAP